MQVGQRLISVLAAVLLCLTAILTPRTSTAQTVINNGRVVTTPVFNTQVTVGGLAVPEGSPLGPGLVLSGGPTVAELNGDFGQVSQPIYNPLNSPPNPFSGNIIPVSLLSSGTFVPLGGNAAIGGSAGSPSASVSVDGAGSAWNIGNNLSIGATGTLTVTAGGAVIVGWIPPNTPGGSIGSPTGAVINAGNVSIDGASSLAVCCSGYTGVGTYTQTAGTTDVDGTLMAVGGVYINGGTLSGSGTVNGSVVNGATVYPGDPVTLTINGNYTQNASGTLVIDISSATNYTMLDVIGNATLDGIVEFDFLNGYVPGANTDFAFLHVTGSVSGGFAGLTFTGINCPTCILDLSTMSLDTGGTPPSPINTTLEPRSLLLFGTGLLGLTWTLRRTLRAPAV
ncbi:MAG TPA: hypothetical protein VGY31_07930 [Terriglobia bacterium]|nr:hypothetical protein [Terriglobia bacterium]